MKINVPDCDIDSQMHLISFQSKIMYIQLQHIWLIYGIIVHKKTYKFLNTYVSTKDTQLRRKRQNSGCDIDMQCIKTSFP